MLFDEPYEQRIGPDDLTAALSAWADFKPFQSNFEAALSLNATRRWAEHTGVELVAMLVESGHLAPGEDPRDALQRLLEEE